MDTKWLVAVELHEQVADQVLQRAIALADSPDSLEVVHVVEPASIHYSIDPSLTGSMYRSLCDGAVQHAQQRLWTLCKPLGIPEQQCLVRFGRVAHELGELLEQGDYQALVIGSHGYAGWRRVLGSKASAILRVSPVDTWVVKIDP